MKSLFLYFALLFSTFCFCQNNFIKGYYIDNSGKKIDCFINNTDPKYNPISFEVKNTLEENTHEVTISEAKEFYINENSKYVRENVTMDISKEETDYSNTKEPIFKPYTVFLKVLIEGKNSLYSYENNEFPMRFFF